MAYLLDTDIVIPFLAGDAATKQLVDSLIPNGIAVSLVTSVQTPQGIIESADPGAARSAFEALLADVPVLACSTEVARRRAEPRGDLKRQGNRVRPRALDLITASTAPEHHLTLVARIKVDYHDIPGLPLL